MPESTLRWQSFNQKKPYFIATVFSLVAMAFAVGYLFERLAGEKKGQVERLDGEISPLKAKEGSFNREYRELKRLQSQMDRMDLWIQDRFYWVDVMSELRNVLIRTEAATKKKLGADAGVWIEQMMAMTPSGASTPGAAPTVPQPGQPASGTAAPGTMGTESTNAPPISLTIRAISLGQISPSANIDIAYALENELKASPLVDAQGTQLSPEIRMDDASGTFTFGVTLVLKQPLKF